MNYIHRAKQDLIRDRKETSLGWALSELGLMRIVSHKGTNSVWPNSVENCGSQQLWWKQMEGGRTVCCETGVEVQFCKMEISRARWWLRKLWMDFNTRSWAFKSNYAGKQSMVRFNTTHKTKTKAHGSWPAMWHVLLYMFIPDASVEGAGQGH